jgi:nucleoside-diphosphate-sugar epimerase
VYAQHYSALPPHIATLVQLGGFTTIQADLANFSDCAKFPEADIILHAAGYAQPSLFVANPVSTVLLNTSGTAALLQRLTPKGRFLFVSSSEVYSGLNKPSLKEEDIGTTTPLHPRAAYIEGKRCGETICNAYRAQGKQAVSARVALSYGPGTRKHDKRVMNNFIEKAICQGKIELLDAGQAVRTYCYIADAVELLWKILLYGKEPVYNVGGHTTSTILDLAFIIGKMTGVQVIVPEVQAGLAGAPAEVQLDLTRVETEFGKSNYVNLEDGLRATIEWQRSLYSK